ncbi:hypothetical protein M0802_017025 [Mischocyttarus mexicanus]|nr:hypothetical protein M0802_017025 [Mischocyttarus mexicanus]
METNRYADQKLQQETNEHARLKRWKPTTCAEIRKFIGLMIWMVMVKKPLVRCWSKDSIYNFAFPRSQMPRNRFELLFFCNFYRSISRKGLIIHIYSLAVRDGTNQHLQVCKVSK